MKKIILLLLILLLNIPCWAQDMTITPDDNSFVPTQQIKEIAKYNKVLKSDLINAQKNPNSMKDFLVAHERFSQSNIVAAYNEYEKLTHSVTNDFMRIILAFELSEKGFFTLAQENFNNIEDKQMADRTVKFVKQMYFPAKLPTKDDELKLAEYYTDIYFNNLPFETAKTLSKDYELLKKTDYSYLILSQAYLESKEISKAQGNINKAIMLNPINLNYKKYKAQILSEDKKYSEALKIMDSVLKHSMPSVIVREQIITLQNYIYAQSKKDKAQSKYYLAKYLFQINDTQRAIKEANASIYAQKNNINAYNLLGEIYLNENNIYKALESYKKASALKANNPETLLGLANVEFYRDNFDEAITLYNTVLKKQKNNEEAILNIAVCYALKQDYKTAKIWVTKLIEINPYNHKAYYLLSFLDNSTQEDNLKKAVSINPIFLDAWASLAKIALEKGDINLGKDYLYPLEYLSYKNFMYYYCKGLIYKLEGKNAEAQKAFSQTLSLYVNYIPAQNEIYKLEEATKEKANDKI